LLRCCTRPRRHRAQSTHHEPGSNECSAYFSRPRRVRWVPRAVAGRWYRAADLHPGRTAPLMSRRSLSILGAGALVVGAIAGFGSPAGAASTTETFELTGEPEPFVVPANVCQITVEAFGAQGGDAGA